ncbi:MAG: hypothetical protein A3B25_00900 [Candidatus Ryanbacteria bacterium RIFCSPLOWO2_01_FULL_48_26]|uniref:Uncharacterized protein n=1 Tax=Candidatus Ryanbacteria bacterium RIFCSPLOWO2_01_FULL_48_26 TaxID=1802126 RepID=A0A1G2GRI4_9BACT|nr:MAG: hypothetical protein A3B25_00900 [Candidatus Ryanbacteria bacterium RIFCSPLOWO2_01_FULL_48_26]
MNAKKILVGGIFLVLIIGTGVSAHAKECSLSQIKFDALLSANDSQNYFQKLQKELAARKELISIVVGCAIEEAATLKARIDTSDNTETKDTRAKISNLLGNAAEYYKLQLEKVPDLGIEGSRYFSKDLLVWRQGNYAPIAKTASNFIVWSENQNLFRTAKNRLDQISGAVTILKVIENESVQKKWVEINELFKNALTENQNAKEGLQNFDPPEKTLASIKLSLESLSSTYKMLSTLVEEINALTSKIHQSPS